MNRSFLLFSGAVCAAASAAAGPAFAGTVVPTPEVGAGLAAMAVVGSGYLYLKRRIHRR